VSMHKQKRFNLIVILFTLCLFSAGYDNLLCAQHHAPKQANVPLTDEPKSKGAKIISEFEFEPLDFSPPKVERVVLENGMVFYLLEDQELPVFHIKARVNTGEIYVPPEKAGLANLTGHVMRSGGTLSMQADKMNKELEFIAASVETSIGRESGSASLSVMKKDIDKGLKIFADVLMNPAFPEDKITMKKDEIIESIRRENDHPGQIAQREFRKIIYGDKHPYSRRASGNPETIKRITRDDLIAFHKKYFRPQNMILGISGDFVKEEIIKKLKEVFADWKKEEIDFPDVPQVKREFERGVYYAHKDINQANVIMGHLGIRRTNPDYFPIKIMNFILGGGGFASRITSKIRSDEGLAYSAYSNFQTSKDIGMFYISCKTKLASTGQAISIVLEEVEKIRSASIEDEELTRAKETIINTFIFRFTTSARIVSQKVDIEYKGLPLDYLETFVDNVKAVNKKDIERVAQKYLHPDKIKILVVGNKEKFDKPLNKFGEVNHIKLE